MKASLIVAPLKSEVLEIPIPEVEPNNVLIRVEACGVCTSELHNWDGTRATTHPFRLGHEPSGIIEQIGSEVTDLEVGQPVAALNYGQGAYAQFITVPREQIIPVQNQMRRSAALAEPLGCLESGLQRVQLNQNDHVAIVGCGFMGLALMMMVKDRGVRDVTMVDVRREALDNALRFGANQVLTPDEIGEDLKVTRWDQIGQGFDIVFETTGVQSGLTLAGDMTGVHRVLSIVGWHSDGLRSVDIGLWNWKAITVVNAHERRMDVLIRCMETGLSLIDRGIVPIDQLITHTYPLAEVDLAFHDMASKTPGFIKAIILPQM